LQEGMCIAYIIHDRIRYRYLIGSTLFIPGTNNKKTFAKTGEKINCGIFEFHVTAYNYFRKCDL